MKKRELKDEIKRAWAAWEGACKERDQLQAVRHLTFQERDEARRDMVLLAQGFLRLAAALNWPTGIVWPAEGGTPLLVVESPLGQLAWPYYPLDMVGSWQPFPGTYDGVRRMESNQRLKDLLDSPELFTATYDPLESNDNA